MTKRDSSSSESPASAETEALSFAKDFGLRYVHDRDPGFARRRRGKGFAYFDPSGERVTADRVLARIQGLVIPPAWDAVWICRHDNGHLQATGRDQRERKQYRYHPTWCQGRNENKFQKLPAFGHALPRLRARVDRDLGLRGLPREKVLAAVVRTLEETMIRIGNDEYAEENDSYGLTTLQNRQTRIRGSSVRFKFRGKSGVAADVSFQDPQVGRIIKRCQEIPGQKLFAYENENNEIHEVESGDVNAYIREASSEPITAKAFRTWGGTIRAAETLAALGPASASSERAFKKREVEAIKAASTYLGNTVSVCRKYYVHPEVFAADRDGRLHRTFGKRPRLGGGLSASERAVLELLEAAGQSR